MELPLNWSLNLSGHTLTKGGKGGLSERTVGCWHTHFCRDELCGVFHSTTLFGASYDYCELQNNRPFFCI
eukprot:COSAG06_NODE_850_length_11961_cov_34.663126_8_plen_70_part_00